MPAADTPPIRAHIYNVPVGNDLCDATARLIMQAATSDPLSISNHLLLLPNNRAVKAMTEAFVRLAAPGLLLPRMVAIGDLSLDEALGPLLDPVDTAEGVWPTIGPVDRIMLLAKLVVQHGPKQQPVSAAEALRLARKLAEMIDELEIEQVEFSRFSEIGIEPDLAGHWQSSYGQLLRILPAYRAELARRQLLGPAERRNLLLGQLERKLAVEPQQSPIFAVGITTSAKAIARLLRCVATLPQGVVILPGVDLAMDDAQWADLSHKTDESGKPAGRRNIEVHPQFHLKHLLDRMGVDRSEVDIIPTCELSAEAHIIADIFCMPEQSAAWRDLPAARKAMPHVALLEASDSAEEAKAIAVQVRGALEQPGQRVAVVTPDRELAVRIASQLRRWGIAVDDSAGTPLLQTPHGTLVMALVDAIASRFSATSILAVAKHPLVHAGDERLSWLEAARALDLELRGPPEGSGISAISLRLENSRAKKQAVLDWWSSFAEILAPLDVPTSTPFAVLLDAIRGVVSILTDGAIWRGATGRELGRLWDEIASSDLAAAGSADPAGLAAIFNELFAGAVVRPPYGGHPRVAIYGLLEARLQQADMVICAGLNETVWPQIAQPDPWLAPAIRRHLGLATLDRNIGLSAHDLATALGSKNVLLARAKRDRGGPTVASRFLLRIKALLANGLRVDAELLRLARQLDEPLAKVDFAERPEPRPNAEQRRVDLSITDFDQLKSDPYSFYAKRILGLRVLEAVDAEPGYAWRGTLVHDILEKWFKEDGCSVDALVARADALLQNEALDPLMRTLWQPRIASGLRWIAEETRRMQRDEGRSLVVAEEAGKVDLLGVKIKGRVDRIDRLADGRLVIIDYKTGVPPKPKQVNAGFALQLGLVGYLAEQAAIKGVSGAVGQFEYWSLTKNTKTREFGYVVIPTSTKPSDNKPKADDFVAFAKCEAEQALSKWILGEEAFTAKLHPEFSNYGDYDQLMRLQEWDGRQAIAGDEA